MNGTIVTLIFVGLISFVLGIIYEKLNPKAQELRERYLELREKYKQMCENYEVEYYKSQLNNETIIKEKDKDTKAILVFAEGLKKAFKK